MATCGWRRATRIAPQAELIESAALFASTGNMVYLTWCLEGLAEVAAARRRFGRAAERDSHEQSGP